MAIYEIMPVSDALKRLIVDKADANVLGACALHRSHGAICGTTAC